MRLATTLLIATLAAQAPAQGTPAATKMPDSTRLTKFFQTETPLVATLTANFKQLRGDKGANPPWRAATLSYAGPDSARVTVPVRIRTRGIWRLKTCEFPPLRLNFSNDATKKTEFHGLDRPKLVNYCRDDDGYEEYLLQEFQLYRVYRVLTPASHAVRLLKLTYVDSASKKVHATRYSFIEEDPDALAARMGGKMLKQSGAGPNDLEPFADGIVGVFQYMIGNTDFALNLLHNAELLQRENGDYVPVVYDFDFSGAVNARYATVDPRLHMASVRERLFRGFCVPDDVFAKVFAHFDAKRQAIYALYKDPVGRLLDKDVVDETLKYFDDFYKTIDNPRSARRDIIDGCLGKQR